MKYTDDYGDVQFSYRWYDFERSSSQLSNWGFVCIDFWQKISDEFQIHAQFVEINGIEIERLEGFDEDVFVDNVWIGKYDLSGKQIFSVQV